jgi:hypothetical protein
MKQRLLDFAFILTVLLMINVLDWDKNVIKGFISGGLVGIWLIIRFRKNLSK